MRQQLIWALKGMAMGAANVIPGVSGGTIAFITNIYERLINALKNIDLATLKMVFQGKFRLALIRVDFIFLVSVLIGVFVSIFSLAKVLKIAFEDYEVLTLSFFFGLIIASIIGVGRKIENWNFQTIFSLLVGTAIAAAIGFLPPAQANSSFFYVLICGVVAICSMILPGLSGSYILLLMGNYVLVLEAISDFNFGILAPLGIGAVVGLIAFSRILSYLFEHQKDNTISLLTGFVAGSLLIIWPWKETIYEELVPGKVKAVAYNWKLPVLDSQFLIALLLILIGFLLVWFIDKQGDKIDSKKA